MTVQVSDSFGISTQISLSDGISVHISLPVGIGVQLSPNRVPIALTVAVPTTRA